MLDALDTFQLKEKFFKSQIESAVTLQKDERDFKFKLIFRLADISLSNSILRLDSGEEIQSSGPLAVDETCPTKKKLDSL